VQQETALSRIARRVKSKRDSPSEIHDSVKVSDVTELPSNGSMPPESVSQASLTDAHQSPENLLAGSSLMSMSSQSASRPGASGANSGVDLHVAGESGAAGSY